MLSSWAGLPRVFLSPSLIDKACQDSLTEQKYRVLAMIFFQGNGSNGRIEYNLLSKVIFVLSLSTLFMVLFI
jgi:hypothetical protein